MNILVLSSDFPFIKNNAEFNLLTSQLKALKINSKNIFILPTGKIKGKEYILNYEHTLFDDFRDLDIILFFKIAYNFFKNYKLFIEEIKSINFNNDSLTQYLRSLFSYLKSIYLLSFIELKSKKSKIDFSNLIIYTFWFNDYTLGATLLKQKNITIRVITGAHGFDLYPNRQEGNRIPFRKKAIELLDQIIVDSCEGKEYLDKNFSTNKNKFALLNSGVKMKEFKVKPSEDGIFRVTTLSRTHPVKRLERLLILLKELEIYCKFTIHYFHIGYGEELYNLKKLSEELKFKKFKIYFKGNLSSYELKKFFKKTPCDAFLNVSTSEGTSMALIESLSYSIPAIVTNVGGNKKIGKYLETLLHVDYSSQDLNFYFEKLYFNQEYMKKLRELSYIYWDINHNEEKIKDNIQKIFKRLK